MSSRSILQVTLCLAAVVAATPASAQGIIEFGGFGGYTVFDNSLMLARQPSAGGRLSVVSGYGWNQWVLEAEAAYATQDVGGQTFRYIPGRARLTYALPLGSSASFLLGAGGVRNDYSVGSGSTVEYGYTGLAGFRLRLGPILTMRLEAVADYISNPANETAARKDNVNHGFQAGLSVPLYNDVGPARPPKRQPVRVAEAPPTPETIQAPVVVDTDRDGVSDERDGCANTPAGAVVDAQGCQVYRDTDSDGVVDARDACPATMAGANIDGRGCVIGDADGDGVTDRADRCPATVAGERVDATGCAIIIPKAVVDGDVDADGVPDSRDRCTATPATTPADAYGCPILFRNAERAVTLRGVNFASGRDELTPSSFAVLDDVARQLIEAPTVRVEIVGHTDATGGRTRNISLSLSRAEAVRAYLVMQGVPAERLVPRGYGPDQPIANNGTPTGRASNRRVELRKIN